MPTLCPFRSARCASMLPSRAAHGHVETAGGHGWGTATRSSAQETAPLVAAHAAGPIGRQWPVCDTVTGASDPTGAEDTAPGVHCERGSASRHLDSPQRQRARHSWLAGSTLRGRYPLPGPYAFGHEGVEEIATGPTVAAGDLERHDRHVRSVPSSPPSQARRFKSSEA